MPSSQTRTPVHTSSLTTGIQTPESLELDTTSVGATESSIRLAHGCHLFTVAPLRKSGLITRSSGHGIRNKLPGQRISLILGKSCPGTTRGVLGTPLKRITDTVSNRGMITGRRTIWAIHEIRQ